VPPSGPRCGDPLWKGRPKAAVYLWPCGPGRAPTGGFRRDSCRAKTAGRPGRPPDGPDPVEALACATGPEGGTRRLFPTTRCHVESAPLAIGMGKASCCVAAPIGNASCSVVMRLPRLAFAVARSRLSLANCVVVAAVGCGSRINVAQRRWSACWREPCVALSLPQRRRSACHLRRNGRLSDSERCARPHAPQDSEEPAGLTLGAGSVGEACNRKKPAGGRPGKAGRFRATGVASKTSGGAPTRPAGQ
jgi:hypothetical protein